MGQGLLTLRVHLVSVPSLHSLLPFQFSLTLFDTNCNIFSISTHRNLLTINVCNYPCIYTNKRTSFSPWSLQIVFMLLNPYNMSKNLDSHTIANTVLTLTEGERSSTQLKVNSAFVNAFVEYVRSCAKRGDFELDTLSEWVNTQGILPVLLLVQQKNCLYV